MVARYAVMINGLGALALTKLDVLDDLDEIKICVGYRIDGRETDQVPYDANQMAEAEPVYETMPGWREKTVGVSKFEDLPEKARGVHRQVVRAVRGAVRVHLDGAERNETIIAQEVLTNAVWIP